MFIYLTTAILIIGLGRCCIAARKNVVVIIGDDTGFQMGTYNNSVCKTPNFDKLAHRSVLFKNAFTSVSSCSPSRSQILTGLPQHQNGMYGLHQGAHHFTSFDGVRSLPVILRSAGIRSGIVGKKHVGPDDVYKFDYEETEENNDLNQVGRNITYMMEKIRPFIEANDTRPFFLYVGFFDVHRCGEPPFPLGPFCNKFGDGEPGNGFIPDWKPVHYDPNDVIVPFFIPDTPAAREDIAAQYTSMSRMDQGVGLILQELERTGHLDDTLVMFTGDNGIPWPSAKTNLYDPGMGEPMFVSSPEHSQYWGQVTETSASLLDITPTVLDWLNVTFPSYAIFGKENVKLTGKSLLPTVADPQKLQSVTAFGSHDLHEVVMYYPMRVIRRGQFKLIHNLSYKMPVPTATDLFASPTFTDLLYRNLHGQPTNWFKTLDQYYYRDEWELFDLSNDTMELHNLAQSTNYQTILESMRTELMAWRLATDDPWQCFPSGVITSGKCYSAENGISSFGSHFHDISELKARD